MQVWHVAASRLLRAVCKGLSQHRAVCTAAPFSRRQRGMPGSHVYERLFAESPALRCLCSVLHLAECCINSLTVRV